jgi:hypothetical protein
MRNAMLRSKSLPLLLLALALLPTVAHAAKINKASATVTDGNIRAADVAALQTFHGGLLVSFQEVGVPGSNVATNYQVTASCSATYACLNNGGNTPNATNKQGVQGPVSAAATFTSDGNGKVIGSIGVPPLNAPNGFTCVPGQSVVLADVTYTNVVITDTTNGVSYTIPGSFSLVFFQ